jgi:hypothetical protein
VQLSAVVPSLTVTVPVGATPVPEVFFTWKLIVTGCPTSPLVAGIVDVMVVDVFAAATVTVSAQELFPVLLSPTLLLGSTLQVPPEEGLANVPAALGVAVNDTVKLPPAAMLTKLPLPLCTQTRTLAVIVHPIWLLLVMPVRFPTVGAP